MHPPQRKAFRSRAPSTEIKLSKPQDSSSRHHNSHKNPQREPENPPDLHSGALPALQTSTKSSRSTITSSPSQPSHVLEPYPHRSPKEAPGIGKRYRSPRTRKREPKTLGRAPRIQELHLKPQLKQISTAYAANQLGFPGFQAAAMEHFWEEIRFTKRFPPSWVEALRSLVDPSKNERRAWVLTNRS